VAYSHALAQQSGERSSKSIEALSPNPIVYSTASPVTPLSGLRMEMSLAPPSNIPTDPYELAKYGRIAVEYMRAVKLDGAHLGLMAQALHIAHHLLFYSAGLTSDVNNDGMFLFTAGLAHYQSGNSRAEPFVDAPFMRLRFQSSPEDIFAYSEIETTMHFRSYISGMVGLGMLVSPSVRIIGGFHHTEFVMPTEQFVQQVNGLEGIISWGM
jgi:hypothetical protein